MEPAAPFSVSRKQHATQLEANSFQNPADFLVMLIICGGALLVMGGLMGMPFMGMGLVFSIVYVWAKENAEQEVNFIFNLATFKVQPTFA
jgi:flagellar biosynthesis component FlhA